MKVLVTGAAGFIGKNLCVRLQSDPAFEVLRFERQHTLEDLARLLGQADAVVHLAGENRPRDPAAFKTVNEDLTRQLLSQLRRQSRRVPVLLASSTQAAAPSPYGSSKRAAELALEEHAAATASPAAIYRLPGVFGKWARPNYNSVVATFSHQIARGLPIVIDNAAAPLTLAYIDDVVDEFMRALRSGWEGCIQGEVAPVYRTTVGDLAAEIRGFRSDRESLQIGRVGSGFTRALYATYISYLPAESFAYAVKSYADERGAFVELLKSADAGQLSYFTSKPGITRGRHYHDTKTEKFVVVKGQALFRFRHLVTGEVVEVRTSASSPQVVQTIPGWAHDVTNVSDEELVAIVWANEVFDRTRPDTFAAEV